MCSILLFSVFLSSNFYKGTDVTNSIKSGANMLPPGRSLLLYGSHDLKETVVLPNWIRTDGGYRRDKKIAWIEKL